ncbi:uncharacterized protein LOC131954339 isoform X2 [Physella acuta]|uniref:uncharacterized protein LOC131954339 isoform X2 n=1 Tax=Physella acuta TaxID=109671 RepID=UPI0027DD35A6|nr:uncharacterized protein LOC131954339 isoform X2 [Physella acuta]
MSHSILGRCKNPLSLEENEKLIELVRQNHALYDATCHEHKDVQFIQGIWSGIAIEMGRSNMDGCEWKKKWRNLRDTYVKKKKGILLSGRAVKNWRFMDTMSFLEPFIDDTAFQSDPSTQPLMSEDDYSDTVSIKEEDTSSTSARIDIICRQSSPELEPTPRSTKADVHRKRTRYSANADLIWKGHERKDLLDPAADPDLGPKSAARAFFESCAMRMEKLPVRCQSYLQLQVSQLFFNAENPDVPPVDIIPIPHFPDTDMIQE